MADEYIRKENAVGAVEFGITLASAINTETGEWTELFQRENDELREAVKRIKDITPADVVPVRHARWRHYEGMYACEDCGAQLDDESPFCPMCGAKMDGECREE